MTGSGGAKRIATLAALVLGAAIYVAVAPWSCDPDGWCRGLVAFDYGPGSTKHVQALAAAALVGGVTWLLARLAASPDRATARGLRVAVSVLLVAGAALSALSHSLLVVAGPLGAATLLWLLWGRGARRG